MRIVLFCSVSWDQRVKAEAEDLYLLREVATVNSDKIAVHEVATVSQ